MVARLDTKAPVPIDVSFRIENTPEHSVLRIKQRKRGWVPISRASIDDIRLQFDTRAIASRLIAAALGRVSKRPKASEPVLSFS